MIDFYFFVGFMGLLGAIIGSFLNVIIYRLPLMLTKEWRQQCLEFLQLSPSTSEIREVASTTVFNLAYPASHCPKCQQVIRWWQNIPLFSYLCLRGRCAHCQKSISIQYPLIELFSALITAFLVFQFGFTIKTGAIVLLTWGLIVLSMIDFEHQLLPDVLTLPLLWFGLFCSLFPDFTSSYDAIIGAITGYCSLWSIAWIFKKVTHKEGMGQGDFKLLALLGVWVGWQLLPLILLLSSLLGAVVGITLMVTHKNFSRNTPIPFGPYLAIAGWLAMCWKTDILRYLYG